MCHVEHSSVKYIILDGYTNARVIVSVYMKVSALISCEKPSIEVSTSLHVLAVYLWIQKNGTEST